jgi:hypothetical protein
MWGDLSDEKSGLYFQFLPGIASSAFLRSESHGTHEHSSVSLFFLDSPNLEGQVPVFISPMNRVAQLYPRAFGYLGSNSNVRIYTLRIWKGIP